MLIKLLAALLGLAACQQGNLFIANHTIGFPGDSFQTSRTFALGVNFLNFSVALPLDVRSMNVLWSLNQATLNGIAQFVNQSTEGLLQYFNLNTLMNGTSSIVFNYGTSGNVSQTINLTLFNVSTAQPS